MDTGKVGSKRAIFGWGVGVVKLVSSSMKRFGVLIILEDIVLTTGMMNCRIFNEVLLAFLTPVSVFVAFWVPLTSFSNNFFFWAPFLARCNNCFAIELSVRLEGGAMLSFIWRGLCRNPTGFPSFEGVIGSTDDKSPWASGLMRSSAE